MGLPLGEKASKTYFGSIRIVLWHSVKQQLRMVNPVRYLLPRADDSVMYIKGNRIGNRYIKGNRISNLFLGLQP